MEIEDETRVPDQDLWKGFHAFVQQSYSNSYELKDKSTYLNLSSPFAYLDCQMSACVSLLLTVGGQDAIKLLLDNGLSEDEFPRFKLIMYKVEELCLLKLISDYEKYRNINEKSNLQHDPVDVLTYDSVSTHDNNCGKQSATISDVALHDIKPFKVVVTAGETPSNLIELKKDESQIQDIRCERVIAEDFDNGVRNYIKTESYQGDETPGVSGKSSNSSNHVLAVNKEGHSAKENTDDFLVVRRSSRQIRVSSKYAESKDAIQNLLKPEVITTATSIQQMANSTVEPPCICSICRKSFYDSKSLMTHWKTHKRSKKDKPSLPFLCQICSHNLANYTKMKEHFKMHVQSNEKELKEHKTSEKGVESISSKGNRDALITDQSKCFENELDQHLSNEDETECKCIRCGHIFPSMEVEAFETHKSSCMNGIISQTLKCHQCSESFESEKSLLRHQENHPDNNNSIQSKTKKRRPLLRKELINNKEKRLYRRMGIFNCKQCAKTFKYERQLEFHMTLHSGEKPHICEICGQGFRLKRSLFNHRRLHDEMCKIKCEFCPKVFVDQKAFDIHQLIHSGEKPYSCDACGKGFRRLLGLKNHQRLHKKEEAIKCDECDKTFVDKWGMLKHKTIHSGEKPFICTHCGKMFRLKRGLLDHVKLHFKETQIQCSLCPRTFIEQRKLDLHMMAHKGENPFICDKCGKGFMSATNLKVHDRCHTGEKPYKCSFCERTFNQQGSLIAHERHHKGERPYVCDICGDGYITKSQLTIHKRKHSNERPYKCDQCDYAAYTGSILKIHKVKHSDEKPFKCPICPSAFKRQHHLEVHSKTHLSDLEKEATHIVDIVIHKCPYCNECFGSEDLLSSHIDTHEIVVVTETTANASDDIFIDQAPDEVAYNIVLL